MTPMAIMTMVRWKAFIVQRLWREADGGQFGRLLTDSSDRRRESLLLCDYDPASAGLSYAQSDRPE